MDFRFFYPAKASAVFYYWEITSNSFMSSTHNVLPSPYIQMIFPLNKPINIEGIRFPVDVPFICPVLDSPKQILLAPGSKVFGMHINLAYAPLLLNVRMEDIPRNANPIEDVVFSQIKKHFNYFSEEQTCFASRVQFVENVFFQNLNTNENLIQYCLEKFKKNPRTKISDLAGDIGFSERWMQNKFKVCIGLSPGEILSVIRFNRFLKSIYARPESNLAQLALQSGYFDQAHSIHDFRRFTKITPGKFRADLPILSKVINRC